MNRNLYISLFSITGIGIKTFKKILAYLSVTNISLEEFWSNRGLWEAVGLNQRVRANLKKFQQKFNINNYLEYLASHNINIILEQDKNYPKLLKQIDDRPLILFHKGAEINQKQHPIAVVGTRQVTGYGRMVTEKIVSELIRENASIISGFMYGIDSVAHKAALLAGGQTIGVLGYGFNYCYPKSHLKFFDEILANGGMFLTEFAPHIRPKAGNFPLRNRIVAGMSLGVIVAEAAAKSGSLITAQLALDYNREVFAIPGPITSPYSDGTKKLLKQGACMICSGREVMTELGVETRLIASLQNKKSKLPNFSNNLEKQIYKLLQAQSLNASQISKKLVKPVNEILSSLNMMQLDNLIKREGELWQLLC